MHPLDSLKQLKYNFREEWNIVIHNPDTVDKQLSVYITKLYMKNKS